MRILVHDYAGHPFQVQLSRELAGRGHEVVHLYAASLQTPRGALAARPGDAPSLRIEGLALTAPIAKQSFARRRFQERAYGRLAARRVEAIAPDWVVSANTPSEPQALLLRRCRRLGIRFASWVQDSYGVAVHRLARRRWPLLGPAVGRYYMALDRRVLRRSDGIVLISEDFRSLTGRLGIAPDRIHVIENWAPLDELPLRPRRNVWSRAHGLDDGFVLLYSGTLGMKHDPGCLLELARRFGRESGVRVAVISEGPGAEWLRERKAALGVENLVLLPFQPFEVLPEVLASADVLLATLEPEAGTFSVPSKILSYHCAGRPILAALPGENLAARILARSRAGIVVPPGARPELLHAAARLRGDPALRARLGADARSYAERTFDIGRVADAFLGALR